MGGKDFSTSEDKKKISRRMLIFACLR